MELDWPKGHRYRLVDGPHGRLPALDQDPLIGQRRLPWLAAGLGATAAGWVWVGAPVAVRPVGLGLAAKAGGGKGSAAEHDSGSSCGSSPLLFTSEGPTTPHGMGSHGHVHSEGGHVGGDGGGHGSSCGSSCGASCGGGCGGS